MNSVRVSKKTGVISYATSYAVFSAFCHEVRGKALFWSWFRQFNPARAATPAADLAAAAAAATKAASQR